MSTTYHTQLAALDALYATLPALVCQRQCQESCGVIVMTRVEWVRIQRQLGYRPKGRPTLTCPMLKQGRCVVQAIKPMICRLWGLVDNSRMRCPWGCVPERWLSDEEAAAFLAAAEQISEALFPGQPARAQAQDIAQEDIAAYIAHIKEATP